MTDQNTLPAGTEAETNLTPMADILGGGNAPQEAASGSGQSEEPLAHEPAPAADPQAAPQANAETPQAPAAIADPAAKPEREQPFWYRKEIEKERRERKALERELEQLRGRAPQPQPAQERQGVDPLADPDGFVMTIEQRLETQRMIDRLERSEDRFIDKFGDETLEETRDWLRSKADPNTRDNPMERWAMSQRDPWKAAHDQYLREKRDAEVGSDPEAWLETKLAERLAAEREAIRQEILAEVQGHQPAPAPRHTPPPATAGVRSAAPRSGTPAFTGPTPLGDILNR